LLVAFELLPDIQMYLLKGGRSIVETVRVQLVKWGNSHAVRLPKAERIPFEVGLPQGLKAPGAILPAAVKNVDWRARNARYLGPATPAVLAAVQERLALLLGLGER